MVASTSHAKKGGVTVRHGHYLFHVATNEEAAELVTSLKASTASSGNRVFDPVKLADDLRLEIANSLRVKCNTLHDAIGVLKQRAKSLPGHLVDDATQVVKHHQLINKVASFLRHTDTAWADEVRTQATALLSVLQELPHSDFPEATPDRAASGSSRDPELESFPKPAAENHGLLSLPSLAKRVRALEVMFTAPASGSDAERITRDVVTQTTSDMLGNSVFAGFRQNGANDDLLFYSRFKDALDTVSMITDNCPLLAPGAWTTHVQQHYSGLNIHAPCFIPSGFETAATEIQANDACGDPAAMPQHPQELKSAQETNSTDRLFIGSDSGEYDGQILEHSSVNITRDASTPHGVQRYHTAASGIQLRNRWIDLVDADEDDYTVTSGSQGLGECVDANGHDSAETEDVGKPNVLSFKKVKSNKTKKQKCPADEFSGVSDTGDEGFCGHFDTPVSGDVDEQPLKVTQREALQPPLPADLGLLGITATVQALGRPIAEGVGHRDADPRSAVLRHSQQDHGLEEAGHVSGEALQPPRPTGQEILGITANVQALGRLLDEGEGPWHAYASQGGLRHSHHGIGPQSGSLTVDQPECSAVQGTERDGLQESATSMKHIVERHLQNQQGDDDEIKRLIARTVDLLNCPINAIRAGEITKLRHDIVEHSARHCNHEEKCRALISNLKGL